MLPPRNKFLTWTISHWAIILNSCPSYTEQVQHGADGLCAMPGICLFCSCCLLKALNNLKCCQLALLLTTQGQHIAAIWFRSPCKTCGGPGSCTGEGTCIKHWVLFPFCSSKQVLSLIVCISLDVGIQWIQSHAQSIPTAENPDVQDSPAGTQPSEVTES